jgi:HAD superfamily hydrolase (TIGR01509 family)
MLNALIFDVDGTLADTEMAHLAAFNHAFTSEGLDWHWDVPLYTQLLDISGGKERLLHHWKSVHPDVQALHISALEDTIDRLHAIKTAAYEQAVLDGAVTLRPGVLRLIEAAHEEGLRLAIATTTSPVNIAALMRSTVGPDWVSIFTVVEDASTAPRKKPDPQVYRQTLSRLGLPPAQCLALEDSRNGLLAATAVHVPTVITTNSFTAHHEFGGALCVLPDLSGVTLQDLRSWHAGHH